MAYLNLEILKQIKNFPKGMGGGAQIEDTATSYPLK